MAYFSGTIKSEVLDMDTNLHVYLPYDIPKETMQIPAKVLYLLHGQGSNSSSWMRWTSIARYAKDRGIAVIMPEVQRSFYLDMKYGLKYYTYIVKELPQLCQQLFHISDKREDTFIAGLSMGGYGAMRIGFANPEQYGGVASMSGLCDMNILTKMKSEASEEMLGEFVAILGNELEVGQENDLYYLAKELTKLPKAEQSKIFTCCGIQDDLVGLNKQNTAFRDYLNKIGAANYKYMEWDGVHDWKFWDEAIQHVMEYFFDGK